MNSTELIGTVKKIADIIRNYYIDESIGNQVADELESYTKSEKWTRVIDSGNIYRLLTNLNCIINTNTDDAHFYLSYGNVMTPATTDAGIDRFTPHYIRIREFLDLRDEYVRMKYIMVFDQIQDPLLIDIRDCPGGIPELTYFILCHLFPDGTPLIELQTRTEPPKVFKSANVLPFYPSYNQIKKYHGRVRVLVNGATASAAESLAYVIQHRGRGKIFGAQTAGHAHIQFTSKVDTFYLHLPYARTCDPDTHMDWEGKGILPDFPIGSREYISLIYSDVASNVITPIES